MGEAAARPARSCKVNLSKRAKYSLFTTVVVVVAFVIAWGFGAWDFIFHPSAVTPKLRPVLFLAGDSLTEKGTEPDIKGWVDRLLNDFRRAVDVVPRGLGGYNTRWYLKYAIPTIELEITSGVYTPTFVTIWFGANDAALPNGSSYEQHVPKAQYKQNLVKLVNVFSAMAPNADILLITPPHVDDEKRYNLSLSYKDEKYGLVDRTNEMAGVYARACVETAEELGVHVLDLWTYFNSMPASRRNSYLSDGLHLNLKGNQLMYEQLQDMMSANFTRVMNKLWSWQLPSYARWVEDDPWEPDDGDSGTYSEDSDAPVVDSTSNATDASASASGSASNSSDISTDSLNRTRT